MLRGPRPLQFIVLHHGDLNDDGRAPSSHRDESTSIAPARMMVANRAARVGCPMLRMPKTGTFPRRRRRLSKWKTGPTHWGRPSHARGESWAEANSLSTLGPRRLSLATGRLSPTALTGIGGLDPC